MGIAFNLYVLTSSASMALRVLYMKLAHSAVETTRAFYLGDDYWPPFPPFEYNDKSLLRWNIADWDKTKGWQGIYPYMKQETTSTTVSENVDAPTSKMILEHTGSNDDDEEESYGNCSLEGGRPSSLTVKDTAPSQDQSWWVTKNRDLQEEVRDGDVFHCEDDISIEDLDIDEERGTSEILPQYSDILSIVQADDLIKPVTLNAHEQTYISLPGSTSLVVCICYLLHDNPASARFLLDSLQAFSQVHTRSPIYVMMNARKHGAWVDTQIATLSKEVEKLYQGQVRLFLVKGSRSKAANLNAFMDCLPVLQILPIEQEQQQANGNPTNRRACPYKYIMNYDVDDRPMFNERSLLAYADRVVGTMRSGRLVAGLQGPCLECYNDTSSGLAEAWSEYSTQTQFHAVFDRLFGCVISQGSNHLILTSAFCQARFNTEVLLEDWRWTADLMEHHGYSLAYVRTMVSLGQTPPGWTGIMKRRNRWYKGRFYETLHDALRRSPVASSWIMTWLAWSKIGVTIVVGPLLHYLILHGFGFLFATAQGLPGRRYWTFDVDQALDHENTVDGAEDFADVSRTLLWLWNTTWVLNVTITALAFGSHTFQALRKVSLSSNFLNGRRSTRWLVSLMHLADTFAFVYEPLTLAYQYNYYCRVECLIELFWSEPTEWVATPKVVEENEEIGIDQIH